MSYEDWQSKIPQAPPWFLGPRGAAWLRAHGKVKDTFVDLAKQSAKAGLPSYAPADALAEIGEERQLDRGPTETEADYRLRLKNAWDLWPKAGTHEGILLELKAQGFPMGTSGARIVQHNGIYTWLDTGDVVTFGLLMDCVNRKGLDGSLPSLEGWTSSVDDQFYSQFQIVFPVDVPALREGSSMAALLRRTVHKWRPAKAHYRGAVVIQTGRCLGWPLGRVLSTEPNLGANVVHFIAP